MGIFNSNLPLNECLRLARVEAGLSQGDVSKILEYTSPQFISNIERGVSFPTPVSLKIMCEAYKIPYDQAVKKLLELKLDEYAAELKKKYSIK